MADGIRPKGSEGRDALPAVAVEASPIATLMTNRAGNIVLVNAAMEDLTGYRRDELIGRPVEILVPERIRERHLMLRESYDSEPRARRMFSRPGINLLARDGSEIEVEIGLNPIETPDGPFTVASIVDADELRRARSLVAAADAMASVHTLASGVAHGINNPLAYVMGNLSFALGELERMSLPAGEATPRSGGGESSHSMSPALFEIREALGHAKEGSARIRDLVMDLLTFSSGSSGESIAFDLHPVLDSALNLTAIEIERRARIVKKYGEVPRVRGDASGLVRVLFNLISNAVESIPANDKEHNEVRLATWTDSEGSAVIEVRDTGSGISPEIVDRIFEPFFTTEKFGSRSGLGLSIAYGIVKSMGGAIDVASSVGGGSAFRVTLPPAPSAATSASPVSDPPD